MITVLIIDDEEPARDLVKHFLQDFPDVHVVGEAGNGFEAMKLIKELNPQLLFLDIQMPKLSGFELLELLDSRPEIIFSTAYDQFAIRAFESNAVDYLLKPYSKQRFDTALNKAVTKINSGSASSGDYNRLKEGLSNGVDTLTRIAVKDRHQIHVVPVQEIDYLEADGDYVKLHALKGSFLKEQTMKYFEENLPKQQFVRIHRSYIVNVDRVARIELYEKESYRVYLKNGTALKASSAGYKTLKAVVRL